VHDSDIFLGNQDSAVLTLDFSSKGNASGTSSSSSPPSHPPTSSAGAFRALPLRAVLAWSDPPASPAASKALVNDLDLQLACRRSDGTETTELGNDAYQGKGGGREGLSSSSSRDTRNNVEVVDAAFVVGQGDVCTVTVNAASVNIGRQNFALVVLSSPFFTSKMSVYRQPSSSQPSLSAAEITGIVLGVLGTIGVLVSLYRCWQSRVEEHRRAEAYAMHEILPSMEGAFGIGSEEEDAFSIEGLDSGGQDEIGISD